MWVQPTPEKQLLLENKGTGKRLVKGEPASPAGLTDRPTESKDPWFSVETRESALIVTGRAAQRDWSKVMSNKGRSWDSDLASPEPTPTLLTAPPFCLLPTPGNTDKSESFKRCVCWLLNPRGQDGKAEGLGPGELRSSSLKPLLGTCELALCWAPGVRLLCLRDLAEGHSRGRDLQGRGGAAAWAEAVSLECAGPAVWARWVGGGEGLGCGPRGSWDMIGRDTVTLLPGARHFSTNKPPRPVVWPDEPPFHTHTCSSSGRCSLGTDHGPALCVALRIQRGLGRMPGLQHLLPATGLRKQPSGPLQDAPETMGGPCRGVGACQQEKGWGDAQQRDQVARPPVFQILLLGAQGPRGQTRGGKTLVISPSSGLSFQPTSFHVQGGALGKLRTSQPANRYRVHGRPACLIFLHLNSVLCPVEVMVLTVQTAQSFHFQFLGRQLALSSPEAPAHCGPSGSDRDRLVGMPQDGGHHIGLSPGTRPDIRRTVSPGQCWGERGRESKRCPSARMGVLDSDLDVTTVETHLETFGVNRLQTGCEMTRGERKAARDARELAWSARPGLDVVVICSWSFAATEVSLGSLDFLKCRVQAVCWRLPSTPAHTVTALPGPFFLLAQTTQAARGDCSGLSCGFSGCGHSLVWCDLLGDAAVLITRMGLAQAGAEGCPRLVMQGKARACRPACAEGAELTHLVFHLCLLIGRVCSREKSKPGKERKPKQGGSEPVDAAGSPSLALTPVHGEWTQGMSTCIFQVCACIRTAELVLTRVRQEIHTSVLIQEVGVTWYDAPVCCCLLRESEGGLRECSGCAGGSRGQPWGRVQEMPGTSFQWSSSRGVPWSAFHSPGQHVMCDNTQELLQIREAHLSPGAQGIHRGLSRCLYIRPQLPNIQAPSSWASSRFSHIFLLGCKMNARTSHQAGCGGAASPQGFPLPFQPLSSTGFRTEEI
ncbi:hypothetical protein Cadr_000022842 [Camelus dromedarius]|uniref:Uncharacterized protein n=1 Tax=Camelus dromedarius TaxID=9838 RepID=A0A5N4CFY5_CAMDR|nr:hypothetical protein Cadr_000022842 [Camelus dromedarius]